MMFESLAFLAAALLPHIPALPMLIAGALASCLGLMATQAAPSHLTGVAERVAEADDQLPAPSALRAVVVGSGPVALRLARDLEEHGYHVIGLVGDETAGPMRSSRWPVLGGPEMTPGDLHRYGADELFFAFNPSWQEKLAEDLMAANPSVAVHAIPTPVTVLSHLHRVTSINDVALVPLTQRPAKVRLAVKRLFDVAAAGAIAVVFAPTMALAALAIRLTSRGPALFSQERIGLDGRMFNIYKFRTMVADAERHTGPVLSTGPGDPRLTGLGAILRRTHVDELPQLWNVIIGDMSMVGPRPERPHFVRQFEATLPSYSRRHAIRPGMTGLAQVYAGYHSSAQDKLRFDLLYISHLSLWLDLRILVQTLARLGKSGTRRSK
ncbi:MAG: sugar transferase [Armatimonadetes bacterium]|nr:sugar transferase [Armatimonadota bacterium]MDE2207621.1 sugar transferase [Armatimonadota bacterium]